MALVLGHWQLRGFGLWAVEERATGFLVGRVGCWQPEGWPGLEIGWALRREFWGQGFATEAAQTVVADAFNRMLQMRLISLIHPDNGPSIAVALRLGMRKERSIELMGHPAVVYGISHATNYSD
jgi:RimJ/RimL family protein N-acetyltransferase